MLRIHDRHTTASTLQLIQCQEQDSVVGPDIDTPQALTLAREPKANVERYDGLRVRIVGGRHAS